MQYIKFHAIKFENSSMYLKALAEQLTFDIYNRFIFSSTKYSQNTQDLYVPIPPHGVILFQTSRANALLSLEV